MKKQNTSTEQVKLGLIKAAKSLGIKPYDVSKRQLLEHVSDWAIKRAGGIGLVKSTYFPFEDKDLGEITTAKHKKSYITSLEKTLGENKVIEKAVSKALSSLKLPKLAPYKQTTSKKKIDRVVNIILSDLHIGSDVKKEETGGLDFGKKEEARRLARITKELLDYKPQYRDQTKLNVYLLGDLVQLNLHDPRDGAPVAEQVSRAIYLLSQSLSHMVTAFPEITVYCATGNHGRLQSRHKMRAVNQKWDSIETIIYYSLKQIFRNNKSVKFVLPKTPFIVADVLGSKFFLTHGDTVLKPGYPSSSIKIKDLENQINRINATLPDNQEYSVFAVGHVHTASMTHLSNGSVMITNGAMVPCDEFAVSIGMLENVCGQYLFESVKGFPVGDSRFIKVSEKDDKDKSLDRIIKAWEGL